MKRDSSPRFTFRDCREEDLPGLAEMWAASAPSYPGGYLAAVPDPDTLRERMARDNAVVRLVILEEAGRKPVGYWEIQESAPGETAHMHVNMHPRYRGGSGQWMPPMWERSLKTLADRGFSRVVVDTWPNNVKAILLPRRMGFFLFPGQAGHMECFLPGLLQQPLIRAFFDRHGWDRVLGQLWRRPLDPAEDARTWRGRVVYTYAWRFGSDLLQVRVDPLSGGPVLARTAGFSAGLSAAAGIHLGSPCRVLCRVSVHGGGKAPVRCVFRLPGQDRPGGRVRSFSREIRGKHVFHREEAVSPRALAEDEDQRRATLAADLDIGGERVVLTAGVLLRRPLVVSPASPWLTCRPGASGATAVTLTNTTRRSQQVTLRLRAPDRCLCIEPGASTLRLPPAGSLVLPVRYAMRTSRDAVLELRATARSGAGRVTSRRRVPVMGRRPGQARGKDVGGVLLLENDHARVLVFLKTGRLLLEDRAANEPVFSQPVETFHPALPAAPGSGRFAAGGSPRASLRQQGDSLTASIRYRVNAFPDVEVRKEIRLDGTPFIRLGLSLEALRTMAAPGSCLVRNLAHWTEGRFILPAKERLLSEDMAEGHFPVPDDFPRSGEFLREPWVALERGGALLGLMWLDPVELQWVKLPYLRYGVPALARGQVHELPPLHLHHGPGSWRVMRDAYARTRADAHACDDPCYWQRPHGIFRLRADPFPAVVRSGRLEIGVLAEAGRLSSAPGRLRVALPRGWRPRQREARFAGVALDKPFLLRHVAAAPPATRGRPPLETGKATLCTPTHEVSLDVPILGGDRRPAGVRVKRCACHGLPVWEIHNNGTVFRLAPAFGLSLFSWERQGTPLLYSRFPGNGPFHWYRPFWGGVHPMLRPEKAGPDRNLLSEFPPLCAVRVARERGPCGKSWKGVSLDLEIGEGVFRGLAGRIDYLTLTGQRLLAVRVQWVNRSRSFLAAEYSTAVFLQPGGTFRNSTLHVRHEDGTRAVRRGLHQMLLGAEHWGAVENPGKRRAVAVVNPFGQGRLLALDLGREGAHFLTEVPLRLAPGEERSALCFLFEADTLEQVRATDAFAGCQGLF